MRAKGKLPPLPFPCWMRAAPFYFTLFPIFPFLSSSPHLYFSFYFNSSLSAQFLSPSPSFFFSSLSYRQWRNLIWWGGLARQNMITTIAVTTLPELTQSDHLSQMGPRVDSDGYTRRYVSPAMSVCLLPSGPAGWFKTMSIVIGLTRVRGHELCEMYSTNHQFW